MRRLGAAAWITASAFAQAQALVPGQQLRADGIPALQQLVPAAAANDEPGSARFVAWHPRRPEMLVLARAGSSAQLHRLDAAGAKPIVLTSGRDAVEGAHWEPERGEYLVFRRDQGGDEAWRLYRLAADGGDAHRISPAGGRVSEYRFLPKGQGLVFVIERLDRDDPQGPRQPHSRLVWVDPLRPDRQRVLVEVDGGRLAGLAVAVDGSILVSRNVARKTERLRWGSHDAEAPVVLSPQNAVPASDEPSIWSAQTLQGDHRHLVRTGVVSGARQALLVGIEADLEAVAAPPDGQALPLALVYNERGFSALRLYDPRRPEVSPWPVAPELSPGVIRSPRWHPQRPWLAFEHVSAQSPGRIVVYDLERDKLRDWAGGLRRTAAPEFGSLRWTSFDGLEISALHIAPPARFEGPRPVLISLHGGPASQARPSTLSPTHRLLIEQLGVHVVLPNVRGSEGFGRRFLALDDGRLRENAVKDVSALLDLIARHPAMDAKKVIVEGASYGGYLSLAVAVHESARIAGSICRVGISNFVTFLEQTESYRRDNRRAEYGDERDPAMREFLLRISPLTRSAEIRKPLFVVHGRNDPRVPYTEAEQLVRAVRAQGTPVWFLTAEDEGHSFTQADNRRYLLEATLQFVQRLIDGRSLD